MVLNGFKKLDKKISNFYSSEINTHFNILLTNRFQMNILNAENAPCFFNYPV